MTIFRIPDNGHNRTDWRDLNRDGTVSWVEKAAATAGATFMLCLGVWMFLQFLYVGGCFLFGVDFADGWRFYKRAWFGGSVFIVAGVGIALYVWRMVTPEKSERLAKQQLEHQRKMQDFELREREIQLERMRGVDTHEPGTRFSQGDVDAMAELMMRRYYEGKPWSRAEMEASGYSQDLWNQANKLLKSRGIRKGNKARLSPDTYGEAWQLYVRGKRTRPNQYDWRHDEKLETS